MPQTAPVLAGAAAAPPTRPEMSTLPSWMSRSQAGRVMLRRRPGASFMTAVLTKGWIRGLAEAHGASVVVKWRNAKSVKSPESRIGHAARNHALVREAWMPAYGQAMAR